MTRHITIAGPPIVVGALVRITLAVNAWWLLAFVLLTVGIAFFSYSEKAQVRARRGRRYVFVTAILFPLAAAMRMEPSVEAMALAAVLGFVGLLVWRRVVQAVISNEAKERSLALAGLLARPLLYGWLAVSVLHVGYLMVWSPGGSIVTDRGADHARVRSERYQRLESWPAGEVAVTLSGGGYRAALTHAGVLWAIDEARIPIHVLSTVSGGSIVGAAYANGWTPDEFVEALCEMSPGMSSWMVNAAFVTPTLLWPRWGSGETFRLHLDATYFGFERMSATGPMYLVVNATTYRKGERATFDRPNDDNLPIARAVAASGAFPVAFDPVRALAGHRSEDTPYIDGGVVENLGIEGLRMMVRKMSMRPALVLMSDVSGEPSDKEPALKPLPLAAALNAFDATYRSLHARIYDSLRSGEAAPPAERRVYQFPAGRLWLTDHTDTVTVATLRPIFAEERNAISDPVERSRADAVAALDTLRELSGPEIDDSVWLGARLAAKYLTNAEVYKAAGLQTAPVIDLTKAPRCGS